MKNQVDLLTSAEWARQSQSDVSPPRAKWAASNFPPLPPPHPHPHFPSAISASPPSPAVVMARRRMQCHVFLVAPQDSGAVQPVYAALGPVSSKNFLKIMPRALKALEVGSPLP